MRERERGRRDGREGGERKRETCFEFSPQRLSGNYRNAIIVLLLLICKVQILVRY